MTPSGIEFTTVLLVALPQLTAPTRNLHSLRFPNHNYLCIFHFPSACRLSCPSHPTIWLIWLIFISSFFRRLIAFSYGPTIHFCTLFLNILNFVNERPSVTPIHNKYDWKSLKAVDIKIGFTPCSLLWFRRSILPPSSVLKWSLFTWGRRCFPSVTAHQITRRYFQSLSKPLFVNILQSALVPDALFVWSFDKLRKSQFFQPTSPPSDGSANVG